MNWQELLENHHIHYVTFGPNTKRGELSVQCPWCGNDDPSQHLGINPVTDNWGCHRNPAHRGKSILYLLQGLLHCSRAQAILTLRQYNQGDPETLNDAIAALTAEPEAVVAPAEPVTLPTEFKALTEYGGHKYYRYLEYRGFYNPERVARLYKLMFCSTGRWKDRLIFPVYQLDQLVAWTGRALGKPLAAPRYLSSSNAIKASLLNADELSGGGKTLFITEGPIDALKVDYYGRSFDARATCVFGTSITLDQIYLLKQLSRNYGNTVLLFDPDAVETAFNMGEWLPKAVVGVLPEGVEDPGALSRADVELLVKRY